jgi:hypothetical protein
VDVTDPADAASSEAGPEDELEPEPEVAEPPAQPSFGRSMAVMWTYTLLRFGLFAAVWGLLVLFNVRGLLGLGLAVVLSVPLSWVLLARPRRAFAANLEQRMQARGYRRDDLAARLEGTDTATD